MEELKDFLPFTIDWKVVGSTAILGVGEDLDIALRIDAEDREKTIEKAQALGYQFPGHGYENTDQTFDFLSAKHLDNNLNLLFCFNGKAYDRFVKGAEACIFLKNLGLNVADKKIRIALHSILSGEDREYLIKRLERV